MSHVPVATQQNHKALTLPDPTAQRQLRTSNSADS